MHSWKYKKLSDEKRKAKRKKRRTAFISHANRIYMDKIIEGKRIEELNNSRFLEKMKKMIWRSIFRQK